jgi:hypothetical protein
MQDISEYLKYLHKRNKRGAWDERMYKDVDNFLIDTNIQLTGNRNPAYKFFRIKTTECKDIRKSSCPMDSHKQPQYALVKWIDDRDWLKVNSNWKNIFEVSWLSVYSV